MLTRLHHVLFQKLYVQAFFGAQSAGVCVFVCVCRQNHTAGDAEVRIRNNAARSGPAFLQHTHAMFFS